jgi:hypothetical protein
MELSPVEELFALMRIQPAVPSAVQGAARSAQV